MSRASTRSPALGVWWAGPDTVISHRKDLRDGTTSKASHLPQAFGAWGFGDRTSNRTLKLQELATWGQSNNDNQQDGHRQLRAGDAQLRRAHEPAVGSRCRGGAGGPLAAAVDRAGGSFDRRIHFVTFELHVRFTYRSGASQFFFVFVGDDEMCTPRPTGRRSGAVSICVDFNYSVLP